MKRLALAGLIVSGCLLPSIGLVESFDDEGASGAGAGGTSGGGTGEPGGADSLGAAGIAGVEGGAPPVVAGPPRVVEVSPVNDASAIEPDASVVVTFNEAIDETTLSSNSVELLDGDTPVEVELSYSGVALTLTPVARLALHAAYSVRLTTAIADLSGEPMVDTFSSTFETRPGEWTVEDAYVVKPGLWAEHHAAAVDGQGNVLVAWLQINSQETEPSAYARWYRPGAGWEEPMLLEADITACAGIALAVTPGGDAIVTWSQIVSGNKYAIWGRRSVAGVWENGQSRLDDATTGGLLAAPHLLQATASADHFIVAWANAQGAGLPDVLRVNSADIDQAWLTPPFTLYFPPAEATIPDLALRISEAGQGLAFFSVKTTATGTVEALYSAYASASRMWAYPQTLASAEVSAINRVGLALDAEGDGMVIWTAAVSGNADLMASRYSRGTGFAEPVALDVLTSTPLFSAGGGIVTDGHDFIVGWVQGVGGNSANTYAAHYDADGDAWGEPKLLSDGVSIVEYDGPRMTMDRHGQALAAWPQGLMPTQYQVVFSAFTSQGWSAALPLTSNDQVKYTGVELFGGVNGVAMALLDSGARKADDAQLVSYFTVFE